MNGSVSYKVVSYLRDSTVIQITGLFSLFFVTVHAFSYFNLELRMANYCFVGYRLFLACLLQHLHTDFVYAIWASDCIITSS